MRKSNHTPASSSPKDPFDMKGISQGPRDCKNPGYPKDTN